jgi:hypothetical protein
MDEVKEYRFFLSFKIENKILNGFFTGINLRHAKEKLMFQYLDASDIMDWTNESIEDFNKYLGKFKSKEVHQYNEGY